MFGFSVVLCFFFIRTSFFSKIFQEFTKFVRFSSKILCCTHKVAKIVGLNVRKIRTHEKNCENVHFLKNTVSPLFLTLKKKYFKHHVKEWVTTDQQVHNAS